MPEANYAEALSPVEPKPTNRLKIILAAVLGLAILAGVALAGYWYGTQQPQPIEESVPVSQPTITPTPTPTPDPTANWKAYKSDKNNYSFRYPPDLDFYEDLTSNYPQPQVSVTEKYLGEGISGYPPGIRIFIADNPFGLSPKKWWQEFISQQYAARAIDQEGMLKDTIYEEKNINNYPAFIVKSTPSWELMPFSTTLFNHNEKIYRITVEWSSKNEEIYWDNLYNQTLSTFKFLD